MAGRPPLTTLHGRRALLRALASRLPRGEKNVAARENFQRFAELLREGWSPGDPPREVLVVGGGITGAGMDELYDRPWIRLTETDVFIGPRTQLVCDGHDLPFADGSFDAVVCQAVLEHVVGPIRVVEEIHRVLRPEGLVYSEVPLIQQVHEGAHDFTRWTMVGHRVLFARFDELESGTACGPGMALAWSVRYFATSFTGNRLQRGAVNALVSLAVFWLTAFDRFLARRVAALDAASATYLLGRRRETRLSDGELLQTYRGNFPTPSGYA